MLQFTSFTLTLPHKKCYTIYSSTCILHLKIKILKEINICVCDLKLIFRPSTWVAYVPSFGGSKST